MTSEDLQTPAGQDAVRAIVADISAPYVLYGPESVAAESGSTRPKRPGTTSSGRSGSPASTAPSPAS